MINLPILIRLAIIISITFAGTWAWRDAVNEKEQARAIVDALHEQYIKEKVVIQTVYKDRVQREVQYRDRIKTVYQVVDTTGCLDRTLSDLGLLKHTDTSPSESSVISEGEL